MPKLYYSPDINDHAHIQPFNRQYADGQWVRVSCYNNQQIEFDQIDRNKLKIPMDLCFATQYYTKNIGLIEVGVLGLDLLKNPEGNSNTNK